MKEPNNREFILQADVALVNNAHDIFGTRSVDKNNGTPTLDTHIGGLFASMKPGSRMLTLHPLLCLGRSVSEENEHRRKCGLPESMDASFFVWEKISLGENAVSWSHKNVFVYIYTRIHQSHPNQTSLFLCSNKKCPFQSPTVAVDENGKLQDTCVYCGTKRVVRTRHYA